MLSKYFLVRSPCISSYDWGGTTTPPKEQQERNGKSLQLLSTFCSKAIKYFTFKLWPNYLFLSFHEESNFWIFPLVFEVPRSRRKKLFPSFTTELKVFELRYYHQFVTLTKHICRMFSSSKCLSILIFFVFFFQSSTNCQTWI